MSSDNRSRSTDIPSFLHDPSTGCDYVRKRFFGKGGFAKCYEIEESKTKQCFAGKIISKKLLVKSNQKEKTTQEITIHKSLNHRNIVKFISFFDDPSNLYIVLELCTQRSMMELHKRRRVITSYECRFYMRQILDGVKYLHDNKIIHRDLKLGNLFLNDALNVKIGDFGLATRIMYEGERKKTLCGTPNYIAPEILTKKGHSFEVDIWSIGCIMYTLLCGQPPFETKTLKETYSRIKKCDYNLPEALRRPEADMIIAMLKSDPTRRPSVASLLQFPFMLSGVIPDHLPSSCLTMAPRGDQFDDAHDRRPLAQINADVDDREKQMTFLKKHLNDPITASGALPFNNVKYKSDVESLYLQIGELLQKEFKLHKQPLGDEFTDPQAQPLFWISKWVDYSDKYGFGYQLCDDGMGVMFNDTTKLVMLSNGHNVHFIDRDGQESYMDVNNYLPTLEKKMRLLSYFKRYMNEHLIKAGAEVKVPENDVLSRIPHLHTWFRTQCAVVMHLTNGTVQFNFADHMKIILCPYMSSVSYMDTERIFRTFRFDTVAESGCSSELYQKLRYAHEKIRQLIEKLSN